MATLTPGVLSKLLENTGNKEVKVTGEHRSPLLQVIEIVPSLSGTDQADPWKSQGFFIKVSDSLHSAYVSIPEEDLDLIYSDKVQLGQFVHLSGLDSGSPVPVVRGLKPVQKRRACVGSPKELVSSELLMEVVVNKGKVRGVNRVKTDAESKCRRRDSLIGDVKKKVEGLEMRRLSLDSARRIWDYESTTALKISTSSASASPGLSMKIAKNVHSDSKALSKNEFFMKPPSLSSSPLRSKNAGASPEATAKPLKVIPCNNESSKSPILANSLLKNKNRISSPETAKPSKPPKSSTLSSTMSKTNSRISLPGGYVKPSEKVIESIGGHGDPTLRCLVEVPLSLNARYEGRIQWKLLPPAVCNLGKETVRHKNAAFHAAVHSLEEASAAEEVILCMQRFAELCGSSQKLSSGPVVDQYIDLHKSMHRALDVVNSLLSTRLRTSPRLNGTRVNRNTASWVQAAVGTNFSKFNLFKEPEKSENPNEEKCHFIILENAEIEFSPKKQSPRDKSSPGKNDKLFDSSGKKKGSPSKKIVSTKMTSPAVNKCPNSSRLTQTAKLAEKLVDVSREWFIKYTEDTLNTRFALCSPRSSELACLVRQLKRVDQLLDEFIGNNIKLDERIEELKQKLFEFLRKHADSTVVSS